LVESTLPLLARALSSALAHHRVAAIDATNRADKEALYSVLDAVLSRRPKSSDPSKVGRLTIVRVCWRESTFQREKHRATLAVLQQAISTATRGKGRLLRLRSDQLLVAAPLSVLYGIGMAPTQSRNLTDAAIRVSGIVNSLELRQVLGLTRTDVASEPNKSVVH
jgi:hypothetical protein